MLTSKYEQIKRKKTIGFSVDADLDAKIEEYADENRISKSGAMRQLIIFGLRAWLNSSKQDGEDKRK
jgi:hypothetical protein